MIEAQGLTKNYGARRVVDGISFAVRRGDILAFLGPNGAGKSTTMKMLTGFLCPDAGCARVDGCDVAADPVGAKRKIGYLPETAPVYGEMTVTEFLGFVAAVRGYHRAGEKRARVDRAIALTQLESVRRQPIETLSKGFRQRVGFAQALLHDPSVLLLDEPTDGLDPNQKAEARALLRGLAGEKAVILSTHLLEEVEAVCTRVIVIARGRLIADDTPAGLRTRHPGLGLDEIFRRLTQAAP